MAASLDGKQFDRLWSGLLASFCRLFPEGMTMIAPGPVVPLRKS